MSARRGWLFALLATLIYSTNAPLARGAILAGMAPTTLVGGRFVVGAMLFALTLHFTTVGQARDAQRPFDRRGFLIALAAGVINGLTLLTATWGLVSLSASIATLLSIALTPLFVFGLLHLHGESSTGRDWVRLGVGLLGLYFLVGFQGEASSWGVGLTALSALLYSLHMVLVQWHLRVYNLWLVTAMLIFGATVPAVLWWWWAGASLYVPGAIGWSAILIQGVLATYVARLLIYMAVNAIGSAQIALLTPLEAALTVVIALLWLHEAVSNRQWVGIGLILSSTLLVMLPQQPRWFMPVRE